MLASIFLPGVPSRSPPVKTVPGPQADWIRPSRAESFGLVVEGVEGEDSRETVWIKYPPSKCFSSE